MQYFCKDFFIFCYPIQSVTLMGLFFFDALFIHDTNQTHIGKNEQEERCCVHMLHNLSLQILCPGERWGKF